MHQYNNVALARRSIYTQSEYSSLNVTILLYVSLASRFRTHTM